MTQVASPLWLFLPLAHAARCLSDRIRRVSSLTGLPVGTFLRAWEIFRLCSSDKGRPRNASPILLLTSVAFFLYSEILALASSVIRYPRPPRPPVFRL